jgi:hypothetical protein
MDLKIGRNGKYQVGTKISVDQHLEPSIAGIQVEAEIGGKRVTVVLSDADLVMIEKAAIKRRNVYADRLKKAEAKLNKPFPSLIPNTIAMYVEGEENLLDSPSV